MLSFLSCSYLALVAAFLDLIPLASSLHLIFALLHPAPFVALVLLDPDPLAPDLLHPVRDPLAPLDSVDATEHGSGVHMVHEECGGAYGAL